MYIHKSNILYIHIHTVLLILYVTCVTHAYLISYVYGCITIPLITMTVKEVQMICMVLDSYGTGFIIVNSYGYTIIMIIMIDLCNCINGLYGLVRNLLLPIPVDCYILSYIIIIFPIKCPNLGDLALSSDKPIYIYIYIPAGNLT